MAAAGPAGFDCLLNQLAQWKMMELGGGVVVPTRVLDFLARGAVSAVLSLATLAVAEPIQPVSERTAVVSIAEPPGLSRELVPLVGQFRDALGARIGGVLSRADTRAKMLARSGTAPFAEYDRQLSAARSRFQNGSYAEGLRDMREVAGKLELAFGVDGAYSRWSRALLHLARAEESLGHRDEVRRLIERLLKADPNLAPDPDVFPPTFINRIEEIRSELGTAPRRRVTIAARNPNARIFVEGRNLGLESAVVSLPPGRYSLIVAVGAVRLPPRILEVAASDLTLSVDTGAAEDLRPDDGPGIATASGNRDDRVKALAAWLEADRLFAVEFSGAGKEQYLEVTVYGAKAGVLESRGRLRLAGTTPPPGGVVALAALLTARQSSPLVDLGLVSAEFSPKQADGARKASGGGPHQVATAVLPAGTFRSAGGAQITVTRFVLDVAEVTAAAYARCVEAGACTRPDGGQRCTYGAPSRENHPINCVDRAQAATYCRWVGKRLPTAEEWEWATRGADSGFRYPWGNEPPASRACWGGIGNDRMERGFPTTCEVGSYAAGDSPQGVKDLAGNVSEWVAGIGAAGGADRGGSWASDNDADLSAASAGGRWTRVGPYVAETLVHFDLDPGSRRSDLGFRCARGP